MCCTLVLEVYPCYPWRSRWAVVLNTDFSRGIKHSIADEVGGGIDCCLISEFYAHMLTEHGDLIYLSDCE